MIELYNPRRSLTHRFAPQYETVLRKFDSEGRWNAPYQFTIPVMATMWFDFQKEWVRKRASEWKFAANDHSRKILELEEWWENGGRPNLPWGNLDPFLKRKGRTKVTHALNCPIRAIAFFSWEESGRVFLARRVFPTFFDFLSYSHCPEGWGALGRMVNDLKEHRDNYFTGRNGGITRIAEFSQSALPFMSEVERLNYKAIFVIPVTKTWGRFNTTHDLLGGFVVFVAKKSQLPQGSGTVQRLPPRWLKKTNRLISAILKAQDVLFDRPALATLWRREARALGQQSKERGVFELTIEKGPAVRKKVDLKEVVSSLIASLSNSEFHAILDGGKRKTDRRKAVVLIAKSELLPRIERVKLAVLRAVATACEHKPEQFIVRLVKL